MSSAIPPSSWRLLSGSRCSGAPTLRQIALEQYAKFWRSICGDIWRREAHGEAPYQLSAVFDWLCQFGRKSLAFHGLQTLPIGAEPSFSTSVCQLTLAAYAK
jgi:hypothetical protein